MDAQLGDAVAYRLNIPRQSTFQALDPGHDHAAYCLILQAVDPGGELGQRSDREHKVIVIERLHVVNVFPAAVGSNDLRVRTGWLSGRTQDVFRETNVYRNRCGVL